MDLRWYETFFRDIALDLWRAAVPPEQTSAEVDFLVRSLELRPGAKVLDVPCGNGRHALELARRGHRMTGVDLSSEQVEEARRNAAAGSLEVTLRQADMRDLPWESEFDAAYCLGNSFGYLDPEGTRAFLKAVSRALRPGGRFVLDSGLAAESILPRRREREWMRAGDILFLEENRYHIAESCVETVYTFIRDGKAETRTGLQWVHTVREIREFLGRAALQPRAMHASAAGDPYEVGSPYLLIVAEKTREQT